MLTQIEMNRFGHLEIRPVSERQIRRLLKIDLRDKQDRENWERMRRDNFTAYVQDGSDIESILDELPAGARRDIDNGYTVRTTRLGWEELACLYGAEY